MSANDKKDVSISQMIALCVSSQKYCVRTLFIIYHQNVSTTDTVSNTGKRYQKNIITEQVLPMNYRREEFLARTMTLKNQTFYQSELLA